ncbi:MULTISPECIES: class I SAM-dependent methyltransferase [Halocynthiibacter]|uniref:Class I SAM-dependent methyltransferase n=1 Tax=Halocynthiibacter halioticoli TaxID=2986804 RepID=A0AAE3J4J4_9RHOB|nr:MULTISPECIES: class I SAM-dependent methyltransferase [Halocynthiibacter]MCV6825812.1 class I SAM-dependent methyltransferase [Halocynthiibacter halioticoli]MCW4058813.1 class I SAM-dependent methyltransferase [Halocynthiibacter sp. SDUM655004]
MTSPAFWDRKAPSYAAKPIADPIAYQAKLTRVQALLSPTDRVLEIGCGTGSTALNLANSCAHFTGTDISSGMIDIANRKLSAEAPKNVVFRRADATEIVGEHSFDVILAFSLLHLVDDIPAVLNSVHSQLEPGGLLISKTVCVKDQFIALRELVRVLSLLGVAPRVTQLSRNELIEFIKNAGFEIVESGYLSNSRMSPFVVAKRID